VAKDDLQILITGKLNTGLTIGEINNSIKTIEKHPSLKNIKIKAKIDEKILATITKFSKTFEKANKVVENSNKVIKEFITENKKLDGTIETITKKQLKNGEIIERIKTINNEKTKSVVQNANKELKAIEETNREYGKLIKKVELLNAENNRIKLARTFRDNKGIETTIDTGAGKETTYKVVDNVEKIAKAELKTQQEIQNAIKQTETNRRMELEKSAKAQATFTNKVLEDNYKLQKNLQLYKQKMLGDDGFLGDLDIFAEKQKGRFNKNALTKIRTDIESLNVKTPDLNNKIKQLNTQFSSLKQVASQSGNVLIRALENAGKFLRFYLVGGLLVGFAGQLRNSLTVLKEIDTELINIAKVTNYTNQEMKELTKTAINAGYEFGRTAQEYLKAVTEFSRAGMGKQSEEYAKLSMLLQNVGDISAETANETLIAANAGFQLGGSYESLMSVIDKFNNVSNLNATSIDKMSEAMKVGASVFNAAGLSIDETIALIGTATASTQRSGSEISRAWRTILMNIRQVKDEEAEVTEESMAKAEKALNSIGIVVRDTPQTFRPMFDIIRDIGKQWNNLTEVEQAYLAESLAGKRQANVLISTLQNWEMAEKQLGESIDSTGSALQENEIYLQSWEARVKQLSTSTTNFWNNFINTDAIKGSITVLTQLINVLNFLVNNPISSIIIQSALLAGAIKALVVGFNAFSKSTIGTAIGLKILATAELGVVGATKALSAAIWASPFGKIAIITAGILALVKVVDHFTVSLEEQREKVSSLTSEISQLQSEYDQLKNTENRTTEQEKYLKLLEAELNTKKELEKYNTKKLVNQEFFIKQGGYLPSGEEEIKRKIELYKKLQNELLNTKNSEERNKLNEKILNIKDSLLQSDKAINTYINKLGSDAPQALIGLGQTLSTVTDAIIKQNDEINKTSDSANNAANAIDNYERSLTELQSILSNSIKEISSINSVLDKFDETGEFDLNDIISLSEKYTQLLEIIDDEQALRKELIRIRDEENKKAKQAYIEMRINDDKYYQNKIKNNNKIQKSISTLFKNLGIEYNKDFKNSKNLADLKLKVELALIQKLATSWAEYYDEQGKFIGSIKYKTPDGQEFSNKMEADTHLKTYLKTKSYIDDLFGYSSKNKSFVENLFPYYSSSSTKVRKIIYDEHGKVQAVTQQMESEMTNLTAKTKEFTDAIDKLVNENTKLDVSMVGSNKSKKDANKISEETQKNLQKEIGYIDTLKLSLEGLSRIYDKLENRKKRVAKWDKEYLKILNAQAENLQAQMKVTKEQINQYGQIASAKAAEGTSMGVAYSSNMKTIPYGELFAKYGAQYGVDPLLLASIAWQESRFNPKAMNKKSSATGIMQILKGTAKELGLKNLDRSIYDERFDPEKSIEAGARYFQKKLQETGGNVEKALRKYGENTSAYVNSVLGQFSKYQKDVQQATVKINASNPFGAGFTKTQGYKKGHPGVDFAAPKGTPLKSILPGEVVKTAYAPGSYGNYVIVKNPNGDYLLYAHMDSPAFVKKGDVVNQGSLLGKVGTTGNSTGYHVHFEVRKGQNRESAAVNPLEYLKNTSIPAIYSSPTSSIVNTDQFDAIQAMEEATDLYGKQKEQLLDIYEMIREAWITGREREVELIDQEIQLEQTKNQVNEEGSDAYNKSMHKQLKLYNDKKEALHQQATTIDYVLKKLEAQKKQGIDISEEYDKWNDKLKETKNNFEEIQGKIIDIRRNIADKVVDAIKDSYEKLKDAALDAIDKEKEALDKLHDDKMDQLDEELSKYEEIIDAKLKLLDEEEDEDAFRKQLTELQTEKQEILKKISIVSLDDSTEGKLRLSELNKELEEKNKAINELQESRTKELRKKNLQDLKEAKQKEIQLEKDNAKYTIRINNQEYTDTYKNLGKKLEDEKKLTEKYWNEKINDDKYFAKIREDILSGHIDNISTLFESLATDLAKNSEFIGTNITKNMIDRLAEFQNMLFALGLIDIPIPPGWSKSEQGGFHKTIGGHDYGVTPDGQRIYKDNKLVPVENFKYIPTEVKELAKNLKQGVVPWDTTLKDISDSIKPPNDIPANDIPINDNLLKLGYIISDDGPILQVIDGKLMGGDGKDYTVDIDGVIRDINGKVIKKTAIYGSAKQARAARDGQVNIDNGDQNNGNNNQNNNTNPSHGTLLWQSDTQKCFADGNGGYSIVNKKTGNTEKFDKNGNKITTKHKGGIIEGVFPSRETKMVNDLFNLKPNESIVKMLKGELAIPQNNIVKNFIPNLRNLVSSLSSNQIVSPITNQYQLELKINNLNGTKKDADIVFSTIVDGLKKMGKV
jgi:TP901 family phage tail tape measure protein